MKKCKCFYYEKEDKPCELDEGIAWVDPQDGSDPYPDKVIYRKENWFAEGLSGDLELVKNIICVQKLEFPSGEATKKGGSQ